MTRMSPVFRLLFCPLFYHEFPLMEKRYIFKHFYTLGIQGKPTPVTAY